MSEVTDNVYIHFGEQDGTLICGNHVDCRFVARCPEMLAEVVAAAEHDCPQPWPEIKESS